MEIFLNILDTAIKIGLGAVVAGIVTYSLTKLNHERELKKILALRRIESLEAASEQSELYFYRWRHLTSNIAGILKGKNRPAEQFSDLQWKSIFNRDKKFMESRETLYQVVARLRLIGASAVADDLVEIARSMTTFRDPVLLQKQTPSIEKLDTARKEVNQLIKSFHLKMNALYEMQLGMQADISLPVHSKKL